MDSNGGAGGQAEVRGCQEAGEEAEEDDDSRVEAGEDHREAGVTDIAISPVTSLELGDHCDIISFGSYKENWKEGET